MGKVRLILRMCVVYWLHRLQLLEYLRRMRCVALEEQQQVQAGVVIVVSWSFHHIDAGWVHNTASIIDHRLTLRLVHSCSCIVLLCHFRWTSGIGIDSSVRPRRGTQQWATKGKDRTLLCFPFFIFTSQDLFSSFFLPN